MKIYFNLDTYYNNKTGHLCQVIYKSKEIDIFYHENLLSDYFFPSSAEKKSIFFVFIISGSSKISINNIKTKNYIYKMQYLCIDSEMSEIKTTCLFSKNIKLIEIIIKSEHIYANFPRYKQDKKSSYEERINSIFEQYIGEITPIMQLSLYQILTFDDKHPLKNFFYTCETLKILSCHAEKLAYLYSMKQTKPSRHLYTILKAQNILESNLNNPPALPELSQKVGLSIPHFKRVFQQISGMTPHAFLMQKRMEFALALLADTPRNIGKIAEMVGYKSKSHFTKTFAAYFGVHPSLLRGRRSPDASGRKKSS